MPTVLLLCVWTLWLVAAFPLLRATAGVLGSVLFVLSSIGFWAWTDVTWRSHVMAWLVIHIASATLTARHDRRPRPVVAGIVSILGFGWLWIESGAAGWRWALATAIAVGVVTAGGYGILAWRDRAARRAPAPQLPSLHFGEPASRADAPPPVRLPSAGPARRPGAFQPSRSDFESPRLPTPPPYWLVPPPRPEPARPHPPSASSSAAGLDAEGPVVELPVVRFGTGPGRDDPSSRGAHIPGLTFDVTEDGFRPTGARRTPRLLPAVAAEGPGGGSDELLPVLGIARLFPGGTLHSAFTAAASSGEPCPLTAMDHLHIRQVTASLDAMIDPAPAVSEALVELIRAPRPDAVEAFRRSLRQHVDTERIAEDTVTMTTVGDLRGGTDRGYVFEITVLSVADLLASDEAAVRAYADVLGGAQASSSTGPFLRALLGAARLDIDLAMVGANDDVVLGLFGCANVRREHAVTVPVRDEPDDWRALLRAEPPGLVGGRL